MAATELHDACEQLHALCNQINGMISLEPNPNGGMCFCWGGECNDYTDFKDFLSSVAGTLEVIQQLLSAIDGSPNN